MDTSFFNSLPKEYQDKDSSQFKRP
jgi:hypothetical protein